MLELLSPAGSPEAVRAAVQSGADAVYLGYGNFNARRNAVNFDEAALQEAVQYCHLRGVKVYLTLNTLLNDRELTQAAKLVDQVSQMGVDALLVQDLGVARMCRQVAPDLPLHASTQMTIHSLDGAKAAADLGMTRVVVSRELSRDQIAYLCDRSPVEIEVLRPRRPVYVLLRPVLLLLRHRRPQRQPGDVRPALPLELRLGTDGGQAVALPERYVPGQAFAGAGGDGGSLRQD